MIVREKERDMADYRNIPNGSSIMEFSKDEPCVLVMDYKDMDKLWDIVLRDDVEFDIRLVHAIERSMKAATDRKLDRLER